MLPNIHVDLKNLKAKKIFYYITKKFFSVKSNDQMFKLLLKEVP